LDGIHKFRLEEKLPYYNEWRMRGKGALFWMEPTYITLLIYRKL